MGMLAGETPFLSGPESLWPGRIWMDCRPLSGGVLGPGIQMIQAVWPSPWWVH